MERDRRGVRGEEEGGVVVGWETLGGGNGVEEVEGGGEGGAVGGCYKGWEERMGGRLVRRRRREKGERKEGRGGEEKADARGNVPALICA